jgi:hypothetical protein
VAVLQKFNFRSFKISGPRRKIHFLHVAKRAGELGGGGGNLHHCLFYSLVKNINHIFGSNLSH